MAGNIALCCTSYRARRRLTDGVIRWICNT